MHFQDKLNSLKGNGLTAPVHIRFKPTNRCNHNCFYCCYRNKNLYLSELMKEKDEIPREKMREIVSDLGQMGVKAVTFSGGGEPLCYPYIIEAIEELHKLKIKVAVLTNGSLLKGNLADILARQATWVRVSIDAAEAGAYAKNRNVSKKEFKKVCDNISNFTKLKSKDCELGINFIVTNGNYRDVFKFSKFMKQLGVDHVKICKCVVSTKREENERYHRSFFDLVKEQISECFTSLADSSFKVIDKFGDSKNVFNNYKKQYSRCPFIQCLVVIAADMHVYTCQDKAYTRSGDLGSLKSMPFRDFWSNNQIKKRLLTLDPSKECNHHCTQHEKNLMLLEYMQADQRHLEFV